MSVPTITLNDQTTIPQFGVGMWQVPAEEAERVVTEAFEVGYRHVDTAQMYGNEEGVGAAIKSSGLARDEIYVTTKLNNGYHEKPKAKASLAASLERLGLDRVDLFLIHWPLPTLYGGDFTSTWEALVELREEGLTTSIGVSNFQPDHLDTIVAATGVTPVVNQIEVHPYFTNDAAREATLRHGAFVEGWSPLGQGGGELTDPVIGALAERYGKTPAQVLLRWHLDRGDIVFPKSTHRERIVENFDVFDFSLNADEVAAVTALDRGEAGRTGGHPDTMDWVPRS
jgi:2,5-diketo-D-gluconate reductase A